MVGTEQQEDEMMIDQDLAVEDSVRLSTVVGGELLLQDAALKLPEVSGTAVRPGAVDCTWTGPLGVLSRLPLVQGLQVRVTSADLVADLRRSLDTGVLSALRRTPVPFRVGATDPEVREECIRTLTEELGWVNAPSDWDVNVEWPDGESSTVGDAADSAAGIGGTVGVDIGPLHWNERFLTLERQGFSTPTAVATVLARISRLRAGDVVLDPFCGAATNLVASAVSTPELTLLGSDINPAALALGERNLERLRTVAATRSTRLMEAGADALPFEDASVDRVISNLPFGKRVGSHEGNRELYPGSLREIARVLTRDGRITLLTEDKRLLESGVARTKGLKIVSQRVLRYGGATPTAYSIMRSRR